MNVRKQISITAKKRERSQLYTNGFIAIATNFNFLLRIHSMKERKDSSSCNT